MNLPDEKIIELYWNRDEAAVTESETKYGSYCRTISYRILLDRQDSEECVNDTWLSAWKTMPPQRPQILSAFFAKIVRNLSLDLWRKKHAEKRGGGEIALAFEELSDCVSDEGTPEKEAEKKELIRCVNEFLKELPEKECNVFLRRYFFGESAKEIGRRYGLSAGNVAVLLSRTRKKLRERLKGEGWVYESK